jgi:hypothetical protein
MKNLKCLYSNVYSLNRKFVYFNESNPDASISEPERSKNPLMDRINEQDKKRAELADLKFEVSLKNNKGLQERFKKITDYLKDMDGVQLTDAQREKFAKGVLKFDSDFDAQNKEQQDTLTEAFTHFIKNSEDLSVDDIATITQFQSVPEEGWEAGSTPRADVEERVLGKGEKLNLSDPAFLKKLRTFFDTTEFRMMSM